MCDCEKRELKDSLAKLAESRRKARENLPKRCLKCGCEISLHDFTFEYKEGRSLTFVKCPYCDYVFFKPLTLFFD